MYLDESLLLEDETETTNDINELEASTSTGIIRETSRKRKKKAEKEKEPLIWTDSTMTFNSDDLTFLGCTDLPDEITSLVTPVETFKFLFPTRAVHLIHEQTNLYAEQVQPDKANSITCENL